MSEVISAGQETSGQHQRDAVLPLGMIGSLLYFGIASTVLSASVLGLVPWMMRRGIPSLTILNVALEIPAALILVASLLAFRLESRPSGWAAFRDRMRLSTPRRKDWLWAFVALAFAFGLTILIDTVAEAYLRLRLFTTPAETHAFVNSVRAGFPDIELSGRWGVLLWLMFANVAFNTGGEELLWRGIVLPRQEVVSGRWAWLVNGILWHLFHIARYETVASMVVFLPVMLTVPYLAQRTRNTWPGFVVHLVFNTLGILPVFQRVIG